VGSLQYGGSTMAIEFDDRALTHLQIVITGKLRRRESFLFSWTDGVERGSGRTSLWMDASIPLTYRYSSKRIPSINIAWVQELTASANAGSGLIFSAEPVASPAPDA
jgi:hypothetical protein